MDRQDASDVAGKRQMLEILCLNYRLDGATLCPVWRKPFDVLAEGLVLQGGRRDGIRLEPLIEVVAAMPAHISSLVGAAHRD